MQMKFCKSIYEKTALLKASFSFTDRVYIHLSQDDNYWYVSWLPKENTIIREEEFENELIRQSLRMDILKRTSDIRKLVLARAYASTVITLPKDRFDVSEYSDNSDNDDNVVTTSNILKGWFDESNSEIR